MACSKARFSSTRRMSRQLCGQGNPGRFQWTTSQVSPHAWIVIGQLCRPLVFAMSPPYLTMSALVFATFAPTFAVVAASQKQAAGSKQQASRQPASRQAASVGFDWIVVRCFASMACFEVPGWESHANRHACVLGQISGSKQIMSAR